jgi:hypothetical protein
VDKVVKIINQKTSSNDYLYWSQKTDQERLEAIEMLRNQYINFLGNVQPRLIRVCKIINRKTG